jgi:hypothetical protein
LVQKIADLGFAANSCAVTGARTEKTTAPRGADEKFKKCANAKRFESYELWSFSRKRLHKPKHRDGVAARQVRPQTHKYWMLQFAVMHFKIPDFGNQHGLHPFGFITWWDL